MINFIPHVSINVFFFKFSNITPIQMTHLLRHTKIAAEINKKTTVPVAPPIIIATIVHEISKSNISNKLPPD